MPTFDSTSVDQTQTLAGLLSTRLQPNDTLALHGDLGAGKTAFVRGLVIGLGGNPRAVSSPTFVLLNIYPTPRFDVFHLDAYRVHGPDDFEAIGFSELLDRDRGVVVIEWPSRVEDLLPTAGGGGKRINVYIDTISQHGRRIRVERLA